VWKLRKKIKILKSKGFDKMPKDVMVFNNKEEIDSFNETARRYGGDIAKIMFSKKEEPQKLDTYEQYLEDERIRAEQNKTRAQKESLIKSLESRLNFTYDDELKKVFRKLENDIQNSCRIHELEEFKEFKDYKNHAHQIVMGVVKDWYSESILKKHMYDNL
jgi:hypothetical protein